MSSFVISSYSLSAASRSGVFRAQSDLRDAQKEVTTGRLADVGLSLGAGSSRSFSMRAELQTADQQVQTNGVLGTRFDQMQTALSSIADSAQSFMQSLIANGSTAGGTTATIDQAKSSLDQLMAALNTSSGGRFLFSGAQADQPAIAFRSVPDAFGATVAVGAYDQGSSAQAATADAFATAFGTTQDASGVATISADDLKAFLDGPFANLFGDAGAGGGFGNFSGTNTEPVYNSIDGSSRVNTAYPAASEAFRNIAKAYVMLSDLGAGGMSEDARQLLTSQATETLGKGISQLTDMRGQIGATQARIENTNTALKSRSNVVTMSLNSLEEVDPYEASVRVTNLTNLLESSYALTARISRLSLLNYL